MTLSEPQLAKLFSPIKPSRVQKNAGFYNLEAWDVIACLNYIFGFDGWGKFVTYGLIFETQREQGQVKMPARWDVAYHAHCRLVIGDVVHEDAATGDAQNQPSRADAHDLALKSAVSGALKRAAKDLGNQFGLSLYNKDEPYKAVVANSLAHPVKP